jgi:hypothetical protein
MAPALVIIVVGSAMTTVRRIEAIARDLQK